jgi:hypothetical protein
MKKEKCEGCYKNVYNHGLGGANECWQLSSAKLIKRKEVHIDQMPPWKQKAKLFPSCYTKQRYVYVDPSATC